MDSWKFPADVRGWLSEAEGRTLAEIARGRLVLEIGSWCGRSTICIAQTAAQVHALDWGKGDAGAGWESVTPELLGNLQRHGVIDKTVVHVGSVSSVAPTLTAGSFDLVFVDGAHDLESVRRDLQVALRVIKPGGIIAMHDWVNDAHSPCIHEAAKEFIHSAPVTVVDSLAIFQVPALPAQLPTVFVGLPTRTTMTWGTMMATHNMGKRFRLQEMKLQSTSLLTLCFNRLWCDALNSTPRPDVFCMLHDDIRPEYGWLDVLLTEMDKYGADVMSAVMPIKDERGLTSTAIYNPANHMMRRLTMRETTALPATFDAAMAGYPGCHLLINTGCWVCRFDAPWVEEVCFTMRDTLTRESDGQFRTTCFSEDWMFSLWAAKRGLKAMATSAVKAHHTGTFNYPNFVPWGGCQTDDLADATGIVFDPPEYAIGHNRVKAHLNGKGTYERA